MEFSQMHHEPNPPVIKQVTCIIFNPAHEYETLKTVIIMCKCIAESLGQEHAIIADESLFSQLMELKRSEDGCTFFFPMLSGLHIWL